MVHADPVMTDAVVGLALGWLGGSVTTDLHTAQAVGAVSSSNALPQVFLAHIYISIYYTVLSDQGSDFYLRKPQSK